MSRQYMKDRWCVRCGRHTPTPYTRKVIEWRSKAQLPVRSVLDIGCGNGRNLVPFGQRWLNADLWGYDLCTAKAKELCPGATYINGVLGITALPRYRFDIVLANYSLMFLQRYEALAVAQQAISSLNVGGWLVIETYPAKDSECPTDADCEGLLDAIAAQDPDHALVLRRSKNRMIIERI